MNAIDEKNVTLVSQANMLVPKCVSEPAKLSSASVKIEEMINRDDKGPYPQLWDYFDKKVKQFNPNCRVYGYNGTSKDITVSYHAIYPMMCKFDNKFHKSNGVSYVVDTINHKYWKICHDTECRLKTAEKLVQHPLDKSLFLTESETRNVIGRPPSPPSVGQRGTLAVSVEKMYTLEEALIFLSENDEQMVFNDDQELINEPESITNEMRFEDELQFAAPERNTGFNKSRTSDCASLEPIPHGYSVQQPVEFNVSTTYKLVRKTEHIDLPPQEGRPVSNKSNLVQTGKRFTSNFATDQTATEPRHDNVTPIGVRNGGLETPLKQKFANFTSLHKGQSRSYVDLRRSSQVSYRTDQKGTYGGQTSQQSTTVKKMTFDSTNTKHFLSTEDIQVMETYDWDSDDEERAVTSASIKTPEDLDRAASHMESTHNVQTTDAVRTAVFVVRSDSDINDSTNTKHLLSTEDIQAMEAYDWDNDDEERAGTSGSMKTPEDLDRAASHMKSTKNVQTTDTVRRPVFVVRSDSDIKDSTNKKHLLSTEDIQVMETYDWDNDDEERAGTSEKHGPQKKQIHTLC